MSKKLSLTLAASVLALGSLTTGVPALAAGDGNPQAQENPGKGKGQSFKDYIQEWKKNGKKRKTERQTYDPF